MVKPKIESGRRELSFSEVKDEFGLNKDDLLHLAAIGKLTIYVKSEGWHVGIICSILKQAIELFQFPDDSELLKTKRLSAVFPEFKDEEYDETFLEKLTIAHKRLEDKFISNIPTEGFQEILSGGAVTWYPNNGIYQLRYTVPLMGLQPISAFTIALYRYHGHDTGLYLKLIDRFGIPENSTDEFCILPDPFLGFQEALDGGKLFVMKTELQKLLLNESFTPNDTKTKTVAGRKSVKGRRSETDERYADWQRRASEKVQKNPSLTSKAAVAKLIHDDLEDEQSLFIKSVDTIRQHIKIGK